ncbi:MAG: YncE family protein, partial [Aquabacterium sp.]|nr:YncE family protein [Aquabacterium sp.]
MSYPLSRRAALGPLAALPAVLSALLQPAAAQANTGPMPIFVLNSLDANVSVIDPVSFAEIKRIPTGKEPHHLY